MTTPVEEIPGIERPLWQRLLHTLGEVLLSLAFAGALCIVLMGLMGLNNHRCNDFGGVFFFVLSFVITAVVWGALIKALRNSRNHAITRRKLDVALIIATIVLWAVYLFKFA